MSEARNKIIAFLSNGRNYDTAVRVMAGLILAISAILVTALVFILVNGLFFMDSPTRSVFFFAWIAVTVLALTRWIIWPILRRPTLRAVAIALERAYPELKTRLISSYDLLQIDPERLGYSGGLVEAAVVDAGESVQGLKPSKIAPLSSLRENSAFLALALLLTIGLFTAFPSTFREGAIRGMRPFTDIPRPSLTQLRVSPGDAQITKYAALEIDITADGKLPEKVTVYRRFEGERDERAFPAERKGKDHREWSFLFEDVKRDFTYRVEGGDFVGQTYRVRVLDRPRIVNLNITLTYPGHTGLGVRRLEENEGSIDVPYGTNVTVEARFSKEVVSGVLVFSDETERAMEIDGRAGRASFRAMKNYSYHIFATDDEGLENDDPIEYSIRVRADEYPSVEITAPAVDVQLTEEMKIPLSFIAEDDYGFTRLVVAHVKQKAPEDTVRTQISADIAGKRQLGVSYQWNLVPYNLMPQDIILYWVEVYDNDMLTGPKMGVSKVYAARFPSIEEILEDVARERDMHVTDMQEIARREQEIGRELDQIARDIRSDRDISYEQREDLRELLQKQEQLLDELEKAAEDYQQTTDKVMDHQMTAQDMIEKMMEIQRLLDEVATDEMREAMKKLQEALDSMDPEELRKAAEQFQMSQEELMERLDRTLSLLKRMQIEQRVEDMKNLAEALKEMQDEISEGLESGEMSQEQAEQMQDRVTKGSELLEKGTEELAKMMQEFSDMPSDEAQAISDAMKSDSPSQKSSQCKGSMQSGSMSQCQSQSKALSEQFDQIAQQMEQMQQNMQQDMSAELIAAIRKAVFDLLDLSARQEDILAQISRDMRSFELARGLVSDGMNIRSALARVTADVVDIANKDIMLPPSVIALLGNANRYMDDMLGELGLGRGYGAHSPGLEAMASMNVAAEKLLETMDQMASSSSCGGGGQSFFQQMQQMADQQGQINQMTMPMAQGQQPGGMSLDQQAAAARLAAEQEAVQKTMEELAKEAAGRSDIAGRMDDIVAEMEQVVEDLRNRSADERTLERQERILSRMLDVQRSLHRQEYEERRQRRIGEDVVRRSPDALPDDLGERRDLLQQQLLRALNQPYPKEYETHIKDYFRALREDGVSAIESGN
ncbi:MAG TPA: hypothetical protein ENN07_07290 [candidate division Zixibacteria bacterium]|nr:hypothetical protein [candidate division Zixibacteria bacterium]